MPDKKPAYVIAEVEVTDPAAFKDYVAKAVPTLGPNKRAVPRALEGAQQGGHRTGRRDRHAPLR